MGSWLGGCGGGAQSTTSTVNQSNIPTYAQPYVCAMLGATVKQIFNTQPGAGGYNAQGQPCDKGAYNANGQICTCLGSFNKFQAYGATLPCGKAASPLQAAQAAVACFSPTQQAAQKSAANLQAPTGAYQGAMCAVNRYTGMGAGTGACAAGYGSAGAGYGNQGAQLGVQGGNLYGGMGAGFGTQGAGMGAQATGLVGCAMGFGRTAALQGSQGLMYGAQGANAGMGYGQQAQCSNAVGRFMNPYIQQSLNPQLALMNQQEQIQETQNQGNATRAGAFGGSRCAVLAGQTQLNNQLAQNQLIGNAYNQAYQCAQKNMQQAAALGMQGAGVGLSGVCTAMKGQQAGLAGLGTANSLFGTGIQGAQTGIQGAQAGLAGVNAGLAGTAQGMQGAQIGLQGVNAQQAAAQLGLAGAGQYANMATQCLANQTNVLNTQNTIGGQETAANQAVINQEMQNYATCQQYPLMELGYMSNMLRGLPMQATTTQNYAANPSALNQMIGTVGAVSTLAGAGHKRGGGIKSYSVGSQVKSDLSQMTNEQLQQELSVAQSDVEKSQIKEILALRQITGNDTPVVNAKHGGVMHDGIKHFNTGDLTKEQAANQTAMYLQGIKTAQENAAADRAAEAQVRGQAMAAPPGEASYTPTPPAPAQANAAPPGEASYTPPPPAPAPVSTAAGVLSPAALAAQTAPMVPPQAQQSNTFVPRNPAAVQAAAAQNAAPPAAAPAAPSAGIKGAAPAFSGAVPNVDLTKLGIAPVGPSKATDKDPYADYSPAMRKQLIELDAEKKAANADAGLTQAELYERLRKDKEAKLGPDLAAQEQRAQLMAQRANVDEEAKRKDTMIQAMGWAKIATLPGSTISAMATSFIDTVPALIKNKDDQMKYQAQISKSIYDLDEAARNEKLGDWDKAHSQKQEAIKTLQATNKEMRTTIAEQEKQRFEAVKNQEDIKGKIASSLIGERGAVEAASVRTANTAADKAQALFLKAYADKRSLENEIGKEMGGKDYMEAKNNEAAFREAASKPGASGTVKNMYKKAKDTLDTYNNKWGQQRAEVDRLLNMYSPEPNFAGTTAAAAAPATGDTVTFNGKTYSRPANFTDDQWSKYKAAMQGKK